jgi:hypothetical protein
MSEWYEVGPEDIDIDHADKEVSFLVHSTHQGNVYLSLSFDQIIDLANKIECWRKGSGN